MRIFERAIARVRRGVQGSPRDTTPDGAEGALGSALSWLGSELRGDAIPERLRDAAGRLASLIDPQHGPRAQGEASERSSPPVIALEDALAAKAVRSATEQPADAAHTGDLGAGMCPFTGLRADGTAASAASDATTAILAESEARVPPDDAAEAPAIPEAHAKARRKSKERLAGEQSVENTSARSATRPARKQPRSRAQATKKKA